VQLENERLNALTPIERMQLIQWAGPNKFEAYAQKAHKLYCRGEKLTKELDPAIQNLPVPKKSLPFVSSEPSEALIPKYVELGIEEGWFESAFANVFGTRILKNLGYRQPVGVTAKMADIDLGEVLRLLKEKSKNPAFLPKDILNMIGRLFSLKKEEMDPLLASYPEEEKPEEALPASAPEQEEAKEEDAPEEEGAKLSELEEQNEKLQEEVKKWKKKSETNASYADRYKALVKNLDLIRSNIPNVTLRAVNKSALRAKLQDELKELNASMKAKNYEAMQETFVDAYLITSLLLEEQSHE